MQIKTSLIPEFEELYERFLQSDGGLALLTVEGIAPPNSATDLIPCVFIAQHTLYANSNGLNSFPPLPSHNCLL